MGLLIIAPVVRRLHVSGRLSSGRLRLDPPQAHHARDVLRLHVGDPVELFDDAGRVAQAVIESCDTDGVSVAVGTVAIASDPVPITIASAVPKGDRADWMIEKLSELGITRFIPLKTDRSVVHPTGPSKLERWRRIAAESAKQSRRPGVMQVDELTPLEQLLASGDARVASFYLSTAPDARSFDSSFIHPPSSLFLIGPEGGWTDQEIARFDSGNLTPLKLTGTILRVETAAIATAVVAAVLARVESAP